MAYKIFTINPGSTSTKIALFEDVKKVFSANVAHDAEELKKFKEIGDQFEYRKDTILAELKKAGQDISDCDAFSGRGGGVEPCVGGTYRVSDLLYQHAKEGRSVKHPANLGPGLVKYFADKYGAQAFIVNPPDTDEFIDVARITGWKGVYRESKIHALNQKEIGIRYAAAHGKKYEDMNLIICHIGGGVSVTAHEHGKMIDSNDIAQGDGPMAPTRCGAIPVKNVIDVCFSGQYTAEEMYKRVTKSGGFVDHLGTSDAQEVEKMIQAGNRYAKIVYDAMIYQIGKYAGSMAVSLQGQVDGIILTGGIAHDQYLTEKLKGMIGWIAPVTVMAGEFEMEALAAGALRVLRKEEKAKDYTGIPVWNGFEEV